MSASALCCPFVSNNFQQSNLVTPVFDNDTKYPRRVGTHLLPILEPTNRGRQVQSAGGLLQKDSRRQTRRADHTFCVVSGGRQTARICEPW